MGAKQNLIGKKFGRLTVIEESGRNKNKGVLWESICECGNTHISSTSDLNSNHVKSCGCYNIESIIKRNTTHGQSVFGKKTVEYNTWVGIKRRCYDPNSDHYKYYGERGISVCDSWLGIDGFKNFFEDMGKRPVGGYSIHRIDENKNYCKENCMWATNHIQSRGRTDNVWIEYNGERKVQKDWANELFVRQSQIAYHLSKGKTFEWVYNHFKKLRNYVV